MKEIEGSWDCFLKIHKMAAKAFAQGCRLEALSMDGVEP